jgi:toxin-antitoxin system PIN domain toxin
MFLVDANILLYAANDQSPQHEKAVDWLGHALEGPSQTVGLPWVSLLAYLRIGSNPRFYRTPPSPQEILEVVDDWLERPAAWIPAPGPRHRAHLERQVREGAVTSRLVTDAHLAALATEHALTVVTADRDFGRFGSVKSLNPLAD